RERDHTATQSAAGAGPAGHRHLPAVVYQPCPAERDNCLVLPWGCVRTADLDAIPVRAGAPRRACGLVCRLSASTPLYPCDGAQFGVHLLGQSLGSGGGTRTDVDRTDHVCLRLRHAAVLVASGYLYAGLRALPDYFQYQPVPVVP